jgi:hypothetical protein
MSRRSTEHAVDPRFEVSPVFGMRPHINNSDEKLLAKTHPTFSKVQLLPRELSDLFPPAFRLVECTQAKVVHWLSVNRHETGIKPIRLAPPPSRENSDRNKPHGA